jgi:hypothetical protein
VRADRASRRRGRNAVHSVKASDLFDQIDLALHIDAKGGNLSGQSSVGRIRDFQLEAVEVAGLVFDRDVDAEDFADSRRLRLCFGLGFG